MEVEDQESPESDLEEEDETAGEDLSQKGADGEAKAEEEESSNEEEQQAEVTVDEDDWQSCSEEEGEGEKGDSGPCNGPSFRNSSRLLHMDELLAVFKAAHSGTKCKEGELTVGLVGKSQTHCQIQLPVCASPLLTIL